MSPTPQLNELCDMCRGFAVDANTWKANDCRFRSYIFHNIHDLLLSAQNDCHLFVLIAAELDGRVLHILKKDWLKLCSENHSQRLEDRLQKRISPTRLLRVEYHKEPLSLRLCISLLLSPGTRYATLSHKLGLRPIIWLLLDSFATFLWLSYRGHS